MTRAALINAYRSRCLASLCVLNNAASSVRMLCRCSMHSSCLPSSGVVAASKLLTGTRATPATCTRAHLRTTTIARACHADLCARNEYMRPGTGRVIRLTMNWRTPGTCNSAGANVPKGPRRPASLCRGRSRSSVDDLTFGKALITDSQGANTVSMTSPASRMAPTYSSKRYAFSPPAS
jgi:hypothetical protein